jgi:hypothetical protein
MKSTRILIGAGISGVLALGGVGLAHAAVDDTTPTTPAVEATTDDTSGTTTDDEGATTDNTDTTEETTPTDDATGSPAADGRHGGPAGRGDGCGDGAADATGEAGTSATDPDTSGTPEPNPTDDTVTADDL